DLDEIGMTANARVRDPGDEERARRIRARRHRARPDDRGWSDLERNAARREFLVDVPGHARRFAQPDDAFGYEPGRGRQADQLAIPRERLVGRILLRQRTLELHQPVEVV